MEQVSREDLRKALALAYTDGSADEAIADLEARLRTVYQADAKQKAEQQKAEVEATQQERAKIVEDVSDWVKFCRKHRVTTITVNAESVTIAEAIVELLKAMPNILSRVAEAKGLGLQYQPADATSDKARARVLTAIVKGTARPKATGGNGGRHGKRQEQWTAYATAEEQAELTDVLAKHKAECDADTTKKHRPDSVTYKYQMKLRKRLIDAGTITAEE